MKQRSTKPKRKSYKIIQTVIATTQLKAASQPGKTKKQVSPEKQTRLTHEIIS